MDEIEEVNHEYEESNISNTYSKDNSNRKPSKHQMNFESSEKKPMSYYNSNNNNTNNKNFNNFDSQEFSIHENRNKKSSIKQTDIPLKPAKDSRQHSKNENEFEQEKIYYDTSNFNHSNSKDMIRKKLKNNSTSDKYLSEEISISEEEKHLDNNYPPRNNTNKNKFDYNNNNNKNQQQLLSRPSKQNTSPEFYPNNKDFQFKSNANTNNISSGGNYMVKINNDSTGNANKTQGKPNKNNSISNKPASAFDNQEKIKENINNNVINPEEIIRSDRNSHRSRNKDNANNLSNRPLSNNIKEYESNLSSDKNTYYTFNEQYIKSRQETNMLNNNNTNANKQLVDTFESRVYNKFNLNNNSSNKKHSTNKRYKDHIELHDSSNIDDRPRNNKYLNNDNNSNKINNNNNNNSKYNSNSDNSRNNSNNSKVKRSVKLAAYEPSLSISDSEENESQKAFKEKLKNNKNNKENKLDYSEEDSLNENISSRKGNMKNKHSNKKNEKNKINNYSISSKKKYYSNDEENLNDSDEENRQPDDYIEEPSSDIKNLRENKYSNMNNVNKSIYFIK